MTHQKATDPSNTLRETAGSPIGGRYKAQNRKESDINLEFMIAGWDVSPVTGAMMARRFTDSATGLITRAEEFDEHGKVRVETEFNGVDGTGAPVVTLSRHYLHGEPHDFPDGRPAINSFHDDGSPYLTMRMQHGKLHDSANGDPAIVAFDKDGRESLRTHYSAGNIQDPAPGVPAQVFTLGDVTRREIYYTQGIVTEHRDIIPVTLPGGEEVQVIQATTLPDPPHTFPV